jgi:hypothetical protein
MLRVAYACGASLAVIIGSSSIGWADDFSTAVEQVLMRQKEVADLDSSRQREMITCVNGVLAGVPEPTKSNVAQAANIEEMEDRFGEMVMADQAALKQQITSECGDIVMEQG